MLVHNLTKGQMKPSLEPYERADSYFIIAGFEDVEAIQSTFDITTYSRDIYENFNENIKFESHETYDFMSFVFFKLINECFFFEKINLYHGSNFIILIIDSTNDIHSKIIEELRVDYFKPSNGKEELALIYYKFFNNALSEMFESLCRYEELLIGTEAKILQSIDHYNFEEIVGMKRMSFSIKKYLRFLLHVGDQISDNDNHLIPSRQIKYFNNLDIRINRLYEFAENIHEMTEHLMGLYDSTVTSKTNRLINKLTLFTVFATPLTVISGIYGMNFVYMPELQNKHGYFIVLSIMLLCLATTYSILKKIKLL